ncbi:Fc receptor-like protein 1 [Tenrec ecaudatus]|uniref:Fc receptor-like protein 1 n=1 Tax=Tenrec ecaudatus TaxID=94439 RepID=UPI003F5ABA81
MLRSLLLLICAPLCEPAERWLHLKARPSRPTEGSSMTLTCELQQPLQTSKIPPEFRFFRNGEALQQAWSSSSEFKILTTWTNSVEYYHCETKGAGTRVFRSMPLQIQVQRVPVSDVTLKTQPPGGQVTEGKKLILVCSVATGTGNITFLWYKGAMGLQLGTKAQRSLTAEFEIFPARESDAGHYYCAAGNGYGHKVSGLVSITVRIPVSLPVITLRTTRAQTMAGDTVELYCEVQRGSPPIQYQFYHKNVTLGSSWASSGGGASFNLSLTIEHSGNYSCEADNGLGAQHSKDVPLNITVPTENRRELLTSGVIVGLFSILGATTAVLLFCSWIKRKNRGRLSAREPLRSPPSPVPQESNCLNAPSSLPLPPVYENVNSVRKNDVYSLVSSLQQEREPAAELKALVV